MWNKRVRGAIVIIVLLAVCSAVGGAAAYFLSADAKINTFVTGEVDISVVEPAWEEGTVASGLEPGEIIAKDPVIRNTGVNDAFVFMALDMPKVMGLMLFDESGSLKRTPAGKGTLLFEPQFAAGYDSRWIMISETHIDDPDEDYLRQVWAYAAEKGEKIEMSPLAAGDSTSPLFEAVQYARAVEGQGLSDKRFRLPVYGYAIQAESLGTKKPEEVWGILYGQTGH